MPVETIGPSWVMAKADRLLRRADRHPWVAREMLRTGCFHYQLCRSRAEPVVAPTVGVAMAWAAWHTERWRYRQRFSNRHEQVLLARRDVVIVCVAPTEKKMVEAMNYYKDWW